MKNKVKGGIRIFYFVPDIQTVVPLRTWVAMKLIDKLPRRICNMIAGSDVDLDIIMKQYNGLIAVNEEPDEPITTDITPGSFRERYVSWLQNAG